LPRDRYLPVSHEVYVGMPEGELKPIGDRKNQKAATYRPMGHLRIIHVRLGATSGFMSDVAPRVKSAGSGNGPATMAPPRRFHRGTTKRRCNLQSRILVHSYSTSLKCGHSSQYDHD
jgi:hypothetical protein